MARYMGGPRGGRSRLSHEEQIMSPALNDDAAGDTIEDQDKMESDEAKDKIPDASDNDGQRGPLQQSGRQPQSASEMRDDEQMLRGEGENGINSVGEHDSASVASPASFAPVYPSRGNNANTASEASNTGPRPKRQRSLSIPIEYRSRFTTGLPIYEPLPLPIAYGWMSKGTAEHIEDLHLSGVPACKKKIHSQTKIEVLGEYTWIEVTPSQEESYERFPAIYVPGNARTWRGLRTGVSLRQDDVRVAISQRIRDDNLNRQPRYPYEPAFRALESGQQATAATTTMRDIDVVTDDETLERLLSFIMGASSSRRVTEPFRLELTSVHDTLFITPSRKPGSSLAGPPPKRVPQDLAAEVPDWAAAVLGEISTHPAGLPYSGGHYRLVRYRLGDAVLAVRVKVDLMYEHRRAGAAAGTDPLRDVQPTFVPRQGGDVARVWRTAVTRQGHGTRPASVGVVAARYAWQDLRELMRALLPRLWFSRSPFVVDCQVSYPGLEVEEVAIVNSRKWYTSYERGYQGSLRRLAGLLKHLQARTCDMGGHIVLIADPAQVCFVLLRPVIERAALPAELVERFWGPEGEWRDGQAEMDRGGSSTPEQEHSDLTDLSDTPSLPSGSEIAKIQPPRPRPRPRGKRVGARGRQPVRKPMDNPVGGDGAAYESDYADGEYDGDESFNGSPSPPQDAVMVGESAHEHGLGGGADAILNYLALQTSTTHGAMRGADGRMAAVARSRDAEILRGQHSLLLVDRHLTAGMHTSDDDGEWPSALRTELHGSITNELPPSSPVTSGAPTPLGPSDFDEEGNVINRGEPRARHRESEAARRHRLDLTQSGRARMGHPTDGWRRPFPLHWDSQDDEDDSGDLSSGDDQESSQGDMGDSNGTDDDDQGAGARGAAHEVQMSGPQS